jgi:diguanylate cyclase (GGDEF)-like protein/PAS domain S-box-containing protein
VRSDAETQVLDVSTLRMREATITAAVWLTFAVGVLGGVYVALTLGRPHRTELSILFALSVLSSIGVALLPRQRIVRSRMREPFFLTWTLSDFAMLFVGSLADGGTGSPLTLVFFIPVVFSSMSYPLASVVAVGIASVATYLAVALVSGGSGLGYEIAFAFSLLCTAAMSAWQASNHKRQNRALATASRSDPLTGCLNRRGFEERAVAEIDAMRRRERRGAIFVLDIDNFKPVNDTLGHAAGDELLCWVVETLERFVRSNDAVGRLGGDEFAVLLPELAPEDAEASVRRIAEALRQRAPASIGMAVYPDDGRTLEQLTRRADARLYGSRQGRYRDRRRNRWAQAAAQAGLAAGHETPFTPGSPAAIDLWQAALKAMPARVPHGEQPGELHAALLDQIDASVLATDMAGTVISWNKGAEALYGWTAEEALGRNARDLVVPEDTEAAEKLVVELARDGRWDGELPVRRKDGTVFTVYVRNRLVTDEDGAATAIVGVAVDISGRVAAETELLQSRNYANAVTECMGEGLLTVDVEGRITYTNRAAEALLDWPAGELRGQLAAEVVYTPRVDDPNAPPHDRPIERALRREVTLRVEDDVFMTREGHALPVAYTATPFLTDDGLHGCVVIFQDISERRRIERERERDVATLATINRVESAIVEGRFVLHAQPIVDLQSGEAVQHELLLRMREQDGELVAPGEFLSVAEKYALIGEIDWWVIKQATRLAGSGCPVELNISARSVGDPDVLEHIERCIEQCGVEPGKLVFEITETAIIESREAARKFAERLHALGCEVALDDFGTGYGTLSYLKQIPVDYLKLDIEFVRDLATNTASRAVVQAVVALAHDFGLRTVGEGVEDAETLDLLSELGVDFAQGFHLAHPEPFLERPGDQREPVKIDARALRHGGSRRLAMGRAGAGFGQRVASSPRR